MATQKRKAKTMKHNYQVIVGNVGTVYDGFNETEATNAFKAYVIRSTLPVGRASGESVYLMFDGEIEQEYQSPLEDA